MRSGYSIIAKFCAALCAAAPIVAQAQGRGAVDDQRLLAAAKAGTSGLRRSGGSTAAMWPGWHPPGSTRSER
jgi:hypothetical protein